MPLPLLEPQAREAIAALSLLLLSTGCSAPPPSSQAEEERSTATTVGEHLRLAPVWLPTSTMSTPRAGPAAVESGGVIYVLGGVDGKDFLQTTEYARILPDGTLGPFQAGPSMQEPRGFFDAELFDGYVYAIGGGKGSYGSVLLRSVERAQIQADGTLSEWTLLEQEMNIPRRCTKTVVMNGTVYALGGFGGDMLDSVEHATLLPGGGSGAWLLESERLTQPRYISGLHTVGATTYVLGGHDQVEGVGMPDVEFSRVIDEAGFGPWTAGPPMSQGRYGLTVTDHDGWLYALGGITGAEYLDTIEAAPIGPDGALGPWKTLETKMPTPRMEFASVVAGGVIYAIGGTNRDGYVSSVAYASLASDGHLGSWLTDSQWAAVAVAEQAAAQAAEAARQLLIGEVLTAIPANRYTYLQVRRYDGAVGWLAGPAVDARVGDTIRYTQGVVMQNFFSKELQRNFPIVLFVGTIEPVGRPGAPPPTGG